MGKQFTFLATHISSALKTFPQSAAATPAEAQPLRALMGSSRPLSRKNEVAVTLRRRPAGNSQ